MKLILFILSLGLSTTLVAKTQEAIFAGGCFWCVEADFDKLKGVVGTVSGFDGGQLQNPTYKQVSSGKTKYKEVVKVLYDPFVISYEKHVMYYFQHIDLFDEQGQFCDKGSQYTAAIFYVTDKQKTIATQVKDKMMAQFNKPIVTQILPTTNFVKASEYHQNYYKKNPIRYHYYRYRCGRDKRLHEIWHD